MIKKLIFLLVIFINSFSFCMGPNMLNDHAGVKRKAAISDSNNKKQKENREDIIKIYQQEFLKIVKPGLESFLCGSKLNFKEYNNKITAISTKYIASQTNSGLLIEDLNGKEIFFRGARPIMYGSQILAISEDAKYFVLASRNILQIWKVKNSKPERKIQFEPNIKFKKVILDRNLKFMVVSSVTNDSVQNRLIKLKFDKLWGNLKEDLIRTWLNDDPFCLSNSKFLVTANKNCTINLINLQNMSESTYDPFAKPTINSWDMIHSISVTNCDNFLIVSDGKNIKVFKVTEVDNEFQLKELPNQIILTLSNFEQDRLFEMSAVTNRYAIADSGNSYGESILFDFKDLDNIIARPIAGTEYMDLELTKDNSILKFSEERWVPHGGGETEINLYGYSVLNNWIIDELSLNKLIILRDLVTKNEPDKFMRHFEIVKENFNQNLQKYIERYLRNKLIDYYVCGNYSNPHIEKIINNYLELSNSHE